MNEPAYPFRNTADRLSFTFKSVSSERIINKLVLYDTIDENTVNLALIDVMPDGRLADEVVSDNQDIDKVIATVVETIFAFFETYPEKKIYFQGSDAVRTRLYRILISRELAEATKLFLIYGRRIGGDYEVFRPNLPYTGFIIELKSQSNEKV